MGSARTHSSGRRRFTIGIWVLGAVLAVTARIASATIYHVAPTGSDTNPGTADSPFKSIQRAIDGTVAGDTVEVAAGLYRERPIVTAANSGTPGAPITIRGASGAIIDGSEDVALNWTLSSCCGGGVYVAPLAWDTNAVFAGEQSIQELWWGSAQYAVLGQWSPWYYLRQFTYGMKNVPGLPDYNETWGADLWGALPEGWNAIRGLALWKGDDHTLWVKLMPGGEGSTPLDVTQQVMRVSPADSSIVTIDGADDIILDGFALKYGYRAVTVRNSRGVEIKNCVMKPVYNGIGLYDGSDGVSVHNNEYSKNAMVRTSTRNETDNVWHQNKNPLQYRGTQDKAFLWGLKSKGNNRIYDNWVHDAAIGVALGTHLTPAEEAQWGVNVEVNHNLFENLYQDAFGGGGNCYLNKLHHNVARNVLQMGRLYNVLTGPFYIYNNIILPGPMTANNIVFYGDSSGQVPQVFIYNNTTVNPLDSPALSEPGVVGAGVFHPNNMPEYGASLLNHHIYNNLFYGDRWLKTYSSGEDFHWDGDYNFYAARNGWLDNITGDGTTSPANGQAYAQGQGIDLHGTWTTAAPGFTNLAGGDVSLTASSPARGGGADLTALFGPLPGNPSTDRGALPYGTPMPVVPGTSGGAPATPVISSATIAAGVTPGTSGGALVTIMGSSLAGATVQFGGVAATGVAVNPTGSHLVCVAPAQATAGLVDVIVTTASGASNALPFTYSSGPTVGVFTPIADALLAAGNPGGIYGTGNNLQVQNNGPSFSVEAVLKFDVKNVAGPIANATLRLYKLGGSTAAHSITAFAADGDAWSESTVNWNNRPPKGEAQAVTPIGANAQWYAWDVTDFVRAQQSGDAVAGFYLADATDYRNQWTQWAAKEWGQGFEPQLVVTFSAPPPPSVTSLSPTADAVVLGTAPTKNYGTKNMLRVRSNGAASAESYLQFSLATLSSAPVTSAKLRLYKRSGNVTGSVSVAGVDDDSWTETGIRWSNKPLAGAILSATPVTRTNARYEWDVTAFVNAQLVDGVVSLRMSDEAPNARKLSKWRSKEDRSVGLRPVLVVTQ